MSPPEVKKYSIKIINPNNVRGELVIDDVELQIFTSFKELKSGLCHQYNTYVDGLDTQLGFITPGHGMKGKQQMIETDVQLKNKYV